jgi:hypothetical protein
LLLVNSQMAKLHDKALVLLLIGLERRSVLYGLLLRFSSCGECS